MSAEKSIFSFDEYSITDIKYNFDRDLMVQNAKEMVDFSLNFTPDIQIKEIEGKFEGIVKLQVFVGGKVKDKNLVSTSVSIIGKFSTSNLERNKFDQYCRLNGIAILFQIVRAVIISFTSQTGNTPIIIPLTNIASSQKAANKKQRSKK